MAFNDILPTTESLLVTFNLTRSRACHKAAPIKKQTTPPLFSFLRCLISTTDFNNLKQQKLWANIQPRALYVDKSEGENCLVKDSWLRIPEKPTTSCRGEAGDSWDIFISLRDGRPQS